MANSLGNGVLNGAWWAAQMQPIFHKENVAIGFADTELRAVLSMGDTAHKPYRSLITSQTYSKGTDITVKDISGTDETLTVDTTRVTPFYIDDLDRLQNNYPSQQLFAADGAKMLSNDLDQAVLAEYSNAGDDVDDGDVGGTAGSNITISTSNIDKVFSAAGRKLSNRRMPTANRIAIIGPYTLEILQRLIFGKDTQYGTQVGMNGRVGQMFGFDIRLSTNLPWTATLTLSTNPSDGDTVTIGGVVYTFKSTLGTTAGNVKICSTAALTVTNFVTALNTPGTSITEATNAGYVALSNDNQETLAFAKLVATDNTTTVTFTGYGELAVSETLTNANNVWSAQTSHSIFGVQGSIDLVVQKSIGAEVKDAQSRLGRFVYPWLLYGKKTFTKKKWGFLDVNIDASVWT